MTRQELMTLKQGDKVRAIGSDDEGSVLSGFSQNDPLGVGGGLLPDCPTAYFEGGGWILVSDLEKHHEVVA